MLFAEDPLLGRKLFSYPVLYGPTWRSLFLDCFRLDSSCCLLFLPVSFFNPFVVDTQSCPVVLFAQKKLVSDNSALLSYSDKSYFQSTLNTLARTYVAHTRYLQ